MRGPGPRLYPLKNKSPPEIPRRFAKKPLCLFEINSQSSFADFALRPLCFFEINLQSVILQLGHEIWKIFRKRPLASEKSIKIAAKLHIFSTTTPNPVILVPKFSELLHLSFYAFI
jgi:hypothetical protein